MAPPRHSSSTSGVNDVIIPIVYPDYRVLVEELHDRYPLGHAGILIIDGKIGLTKYYEYGRYDTAHLGLTRTHPIPDVKMEHGRPTKASLTNVLRAVSAGSGAGTRIEAAYIALPAGAFHKVFVFCQARIAQNNDPHRTPYGILGNSCETFVADAATAGGAHMPAGSMGVPRFFIDLVQKSYPPLHFQSGKLSGAGY